MRNSVVFPQTGHVARPAVAPPTVDLNRASPNFPVPAALEKKDAGRMHLGFLDGLRGLAVLYVMFYHARLTRLPEVPQAGLRGLLTNWLLYGHLAVDVFIVLSGFCLMLPVARRGELTGGAVQFFKKRARRILPPFAAALGFGVAINAGLGHLAPHGEFQMASVKDILANLLLLQDVHPTCNTINGAFWSVAAEWKIYFLFPVLVWVWQKRGVGAVLAAAIGIGCGVSVALYLLGDLAIVSPHANQSLTLVCPWYVALFGLGVWAGDRAFGSQPLVQFDSKWTVGLVASLTLLLGLLVAYPHQGDQAGYVTHWPAIDGAMGLVAGLGLLWLGVKSRNGITTKAHRLLSWRPLTFVGSFGYSIYLVHLTVLHIYISLMLYAQHMAVPQRWITLFLIMVVLPLTLLISYGFFLLFERPFLSMAAGAGRSADMPAQKPRFATTVACFSDDAAREAAAIVRPPAAAAEA